MAATGTAIAAPAPAGAAPKAPAGGKAAAALKRRRFRLLGIGSKLTAFTVLLFGLVIIAVGYSLFRQQRQSLTREVLSRGRTIAQNLASAYGDVILTKDTLAAQTLATGAVEQRKEDMFLRRGHDLGSPSDWMVGILAAFQDLRISVPSLLEQELDSLAGTRLNLGWIVPASSARSIVNEGIAEAIIVDNTGMIVAHYLGTSELG
jgi:hypothetical protein